MSKSQIFPEIHYGFTNLSREEISVAHKENKTITGFVEEILEDKKEIIVRLGVNIIGHLPFDEVTIYPYAYSSNTAHTLPIQIYTLQWKNIRVKVTEITGDTIILSRKKNMVEAYNYLKTCSSVQLHITNVISSAAFGDIGEGIISCLKLRNVCKARLRNIAEYFHKNDRIWVAIIRHDDENYQFTLSYKDTFPKYDPKDYHFGDVYTARICEAVDEVHSGYFVDISPNVSGIMDTNELTPLLRYGDCVECCVNKSLKTGLKLRFLRKL